MTSMKNPAGITEMHYEIGPYPTPKRFAYVKCAGFIRNAEGSKLAHKNKISSQNQTSKVPNWTTTIDYTNKCNM